MTVQELIEELQKMPQDYIVEYWGDDGKWYSPQEIWINRIENDFIDTKTVRIR